MKLPKALRKALVGLSVFPLTDEWLLIPDMAGLMYTSPDGLRWRKAPRPPRMEEGYVSWLAEVGDEVQAHGWAPDRKNQPQVLWTFVPGEPVAKARVAPEGFVDRQPVEWDDGLIGYGHTGDGDDTILVMWRWDPPVTEMGTDAPITSDDPEPTPVPPEDG